MSKTTNDDYLKRLRVARSRINAPGESWNKVMHELGDLMLENPKAYFDEAKGIRPGGWSDDNDLKLQELECDPDLYFDRGRREASCWPEGLINLFRRRR